MSKKKQRAWFVCPRWNELVAPHYADDAAAAHALRTSPRVLAQLRAGTPMARATVLKLLRRYAAQHILGSNVQELVIDTRSH
jgi:hypothetical protein